VDHGHSHDHEHDDHNGHNHSHHKHDEESDTLLSSSPSPCHRQSYSAANEAQHLDEVLPDNEHDAAEEVNRKGRNVNLHAAYIHVMADLAQSVVVLIAGLIIWKKPTWQLTDPICTLIFSIMVCYSTVGVIRSSLSVLLEEVPPGVDWEGMYDAISSVEGVSNVHDLHIWSISHGHSILSVHGTANDVKQAYHDIKKLCNRKNISHLTVQLQPRTIDGCLTCSTQSAHLCR
jgi:zinc transporter 2